MESKPAGKSLYGFSLSKRKGRFGTAAVCLMVLLSFALGSGIGYVYSRDQAPAFESFADASEPFFNDSTIPFSDLADQDGLGGLGEVVSGPLPELETVSYILQPDDTLYECLVRHGVPAGLVMEWIELSKSVFDLSRVKPGQSFDLLRTEDGEYLRFDYVVDDETGLVIVRESENYQAHLEPRSLDLALESADRIPAGLEMGEPILIPRPVYQDPLPTYRLYKGTINSSFYAAARDAGLSPGKIMELIEIFTWEIEFSRDFRAGDHFEILVGRLDDEQIGSMEGKILSTMIETGGKPHYAFHFKDGKSPRGYYDQDGRCLRKFFLKMPVRYSRISSGFTHRRYHPILRRYAPHLAVDLVAPSGTKIVSPADGKVISMGYDKGSGRLIKIRHNSTYTTVYCHLLKFGPGIGKGSFVKQDQVIGYVGSTGLSTGPHLHYGVIKDGKPINPLRFRGSEGTPVKNAGQFEQAKAELTDQMRTAAVVSNKMVSTGIRTSEL